MQSIVLEVTPSQKETLELRACENGFVSVSSYLKVLALRIDSFIFSALDATAQEKSFTFSFDVDVTQKEKIDKKVQESNAQTLEEYLLYIGLYGIINATVEIRSSGTLDSMLERIAQSKKNQR